MKGHREVKRILATLGLALALIGASLVNATPASAWDWPCWWNCGTPTPSASASASASVTVSVSVSTSSTPSASASSSSPAASASSSSTPPASQSASASSTVSPSASVSASASASPTDSPSASSTPSPTSPPLVARPAGGLALTGAPVVAIGVSGVLLVLAGGAALWLLKRRDDEFEA